MSAAHLLAHVVWPTHCPVCGAIGELVCLDCLREIADAARTASMEGLPKIYGAAPYDVLNREVVHKMKYGGARAIASMMGRVIAERIARPEVDALVPIPLHKGSDRPFNQSALIARSAADAWGIDIVDALEWSARFERQATKKDRDARDLPEYAIICLDDLRDMRVCLVDDVCTTGATMRRACGAVASAGGSVASCVVWSIA